MLLSVLAHHSEPGDPKLLEWIQHQIDALIGLGPGTMVALLGLLILAMPLSIITLFLIQRVRHG